jgi:valyl-tRNA synthetase
VTIDQVLRLLHPFVPYLTEALWEPLNEQAPVRGIDMSLPASDLLIRATWPTVNPAWRDLGLETRMTFLQDVVRAIRDWRSKNTISPHARLQVRMRAAGASADTLCAWTDLLKTIAGLASVAIAPDMQRLPNAATIVGGDVEVYIDGVVLTPPAVVGQVAVSSPGVIDVGKERTRLTKQREQLLGRLEGSRRKLANADFLRKANPEVVQKERDRLAECETEIEKVEATLAALG